MKAVAAFLAAARRVGATSVAPMLLDTSTARITVPAARVTGTEAAGPARAIDRTASAARLSHRPSGSPRRPATELRPAAAKAIRRRRVAATEPAARTTTTRATRAPGGRRT